MQVSIRYQDLCVCVINFLNDSRDRIVQFPCNHVAALAGQDFKAAVRIDTGENRVLDAVELNGFFQFPVVLAVLVHRNCIEFGFFQIARV